MKRLTGKRSIKTYEVDKKEQPVAESQPVIQNQEINFTNKNIFKQMIK